MKLYESQWHVRLFRWCRETWNTFRDDNDWGLRPNLCLYIRSIVIWAPLALLSQIALLAWAGYVLVYYPVTRIGWTGFAWEVGVVAGIVGIVTLISLIKRALRRLNEAWDRLRYRKLEKLGATKDDALEIVMVGPRKNKGPGFIEVVFDYLVAMKQKTCPAIKIVPDVKE